MTILVAIFTSSVIFLAVTTVEILNAHTQTMGAVSEPSVEILTTHAFQPEPIPQRYSRTRSSKPESVNTANLGDAIWKLKSLATKGTTLITGNRNPCPTDCPSPIQPSMSLGTRTKNYIKFITGWMTAWSLPIWSIACGSPWCWLTHAFDFSPEGYFGVWFSIVVSAFMTLVVF
ncbi:hypothetical protein DM02DRAFT_655358 [Periconia macrospinosa]|uniref:Uncharacterized protein n=1 Tax=Periconia macrospinosa TaxID=97972 RepID=A0A2V1DR86_9PLEO|nr:hypothetical protein DM02DRAFT_655358 [Periconia macrospinosa]